MMHKIFGILPTVIVMTQSMVAFAGAPVDWQLGLQEAASPTMEYIVSFHGMMIWIITGISLFVLALLAWVVIRYNEKTNKKPSIFSHNIFIEVVWTVIPVVILIIIAIPSFKLLYFADRAVGEPEMTLKVTGYQWYWGYEYPDHGDINFLSYMIADDEIDEARGQKRLLSTDNVVVLPVDTNIQILGTAGDVLHAIAVPSLGIKMDAVPGRLNETWVRINEPGTYYGQCSELCGKNHAYMPIEIRAVSKKRFERWVKQAKVEYAHIDDIPMDDSYPLQMANSEEN